MEEEYTFQGRTVSEVWESMHGDYWVITEERENSPHVFGYARLASMPQFAEWGTIDGNIIDEQLVWQVPSKNWSFTGPQDLNIERV
jgi:hypothetical protein